MQPNPPPQNFYVFCRFWTLYKIRRPGVDIVQTHSSLNYFLYSFIKSPFSSKPSKHHYSQTVRARELRIWENFYTPTRVTCLMLCVTCQVSHVRCQVYFFLIFFSYKAVELFGGGMLSTGPTQSSLKLFHDYGLITGNPRRLFSPIRTIPRSIRHQSGWSL